jgi:zona occludens toxin
MITIITGTPGTGKTSYVVAELMQTTGRNIYVDGIPDLALPHEVAPPVTQWVTVGEDESGATSHKWNFPPNSIIIIDEAQRSFRPRPAGSKVPDYVAALETHRHAGLDFWFITQHPALIESNVRRLCGRHVHIRNTALGRRLHEWTQVEDPESTTSRASAVTRPYKLPKEAFSKYKSAEIHTKNKARLPLSFYVVIAAVIGFLAVAWMVYSTIKAKTTPEKPVTTEQQAPVNSQSVVQSSTPVIDPAEMMQEFVPRVPGRPETAPAFDTLRVVANMPVVTGCVQTSTRCTCINQQGLDAGLDSLQCKAWLQNPPFDPYTVKATVQEGRGSTDKPPQKATGDDYQQITGVPDSPRDVRT